MKPIAIAICTIAGAIAISDASYADSQGSKVHTLEFTHRHHAIESRQPGVPLSRKVTGAIPRAIRGGNPLEMFNPFAPAKYETAEKNTVLDSEEPGRGEGVKLLSISF